MSFERTLNSLVDRLREQLAEDARCGLLDVDIGISDTTVVLRGRADSLARSRAAEQIVRDHVFGHMDVVNELWIVG
jgi:osmotically-inducible protein OsmY